MKLKSFINNVSLAIYFKYRKLIVWIFVAFAFLFPMVFPENGFSEVLLVMGFTVALIKLEKVIFDTTKKDKKDIKNESLVEEAKKIINRQH